MHISPETTAFFALVIGIVAPPCISILLYHRALSTGRTRVVPLVAGALILLLWLPLAAIGPQTLITYFLD